MRVGGFPIGVSAVRNRRADAPQIQTPRRRLLLGLVVFLLVVAAIYWFLWGGGFRFEPEHGETFWHLLHQKGHWYLEIVISGVETILFDLLIGLIG
jgi:hypothetical protein